MALEVTGEEDNIISDHLPNILNRVLYTALVANLARQKRRQIRAERQKSHKGRMITMWSKQQNYQKRG